MDRMYRPLQYCSILLTEPPDEAVGEKEDVDGDRSSTKHFKKSGSTGEEKDTVVKPGGLTYFVDQITMFCIYCKSRIHKSTAF